MTQASEVAPMRPATAPHEHSGVDGNERTIGAIVTDLWEKTEVLVRQEMKLGITEAEEKVDALKIDLEGKVEQLKLELIGKAIGGIVAFAGLLTIAAAIVLLLAMVMKPWLAALLVGAAFAAGGGVLLKRELKLPAAPSPSAFIPERTIESTKRDLHAIEEASHDTAK
jgi:Putative Actinobacterial Holin-X, holin superfamily III